MENNRGGVFQQWHAQILPLYTERVKKLLSDLEKLPYSSYFITDEDIRALKRIAPSFGVRLEGNLKDPDTFDHYLGILGAMAKKAAEIDMRPTDPYAQIISKIGEEDVRAMEGESV